MRKAGLTQCGETGESGVMTVSFFLRDEAVTSQMGKFHADPSVAVNRYIEFRFDVEPPPQFHIIYICFGLFGLPTR
jgi:hypothetical protein